MLPPPMSSAEKAHILPFHRHDFAAQGGAIGGRARYARGEILKSLTILRHAKSGWDAPVERDFDRPINPRGRRGAELIGQYLKKQALPVDRIVASPAVRVTETLDIFQPAADLDALEPHWDRRIYLASAATLIEVLRDTGRDAEHLLIAGHNPGLEDLALMLVPESANDPLRAEIEAKLPTSALVRMEIDIDDWHRLDIGMARIVAFVRPRDLDPALAPSMD